MYEPESCVETFRSSYVCIPNQWHLYAKNIENKGIAWKLNIASASGAEIFVAMEAIKALSTGKELIGTIPRPRKPLDEAIYWIEYVIRHRGAPQLRSKSADLAWYQYYLVDVGLIILFLVTIVLIVVYTLTNSIFKCVSTNRKVLTKKEQ